MGFASSLALSAVCLSASGTASDLRADAEAMAKVLYGWKVARAERLPGGLDHVLLQEQEFDRMEGVGQQGAAPPGTKFVPPPTHPVHTEFFAVREGQTRTLSGLPWGQDPRPFYHTERVDLGTWNGRHWFADIGLYDQANLRKKLGFQGGDDRLALLIKGLGIQDPVSVTWASTTRNACEGLLGQEGAEAIPYLERAIAERPSEIGVRALACIGAIQDPDATRILLNHFENPNQKLRDAAAAGLTREPYREEARSAYLAMIEQIRFARGGAKAAIRFGWKEALPLVAKALESSNYLFVYRDLYDSYRTLEGRPIAKELFEAERHIWGSAFKSAGPPTDVAEAKSTLGKSPDHEAVALIAFDLSTFGTKADTRDVQALGLEILNGLPRQPAIAAIRKMMNCVKSDPKRAQAQKILAEWGAVKPASLLPDWIR